jgi:hypothetical protein
METFTDIDRLLAEIEDDASGLSLEERFDKLLQQLLAVQFVIIERQRKTGKPVEEHEQIWINDSMKFMKNIEKLFSMAKKYNRISTKPNANFEQQTISTIKELKSSLGDIVRKIPMKDDSRESE